MSRRIIPSINFDLTNQKFNEFFGCKDTAPPFDTQWEIVEDNYQLKIPMETVDKKDIRVELSCKFVTVSSEQHYGSGTVCSYSNIFSLPEDLIESSLEAEFKDHVLFLKGKRNLDTVSVRVIEVK